MSFFARDGERVCWPRWSRSRGNGCYFHQIKAAIARQDPVSLNHRVAAWPASYFDILFAINGQFHPGEKRLLIYAEELANLPSNAVLDVQHLCAFAGKLDTPIVAHLERMLERLDQKLIEFGRFAPCRSAL